MRKISKAFVASGVGLAILVPSSAALAAATTTTTSKPACTAEQREERWAVRDELRDQIRAQLEKEGVTDPVQLREQLQVRLHDAMEQRLGVVGMGSGAMHRSGPQDGSGPRADRPLDGTGNRWGAAG